MGFGSSRWLRGVDWCFRGASSHWRCWITKIRRSFVSMSVLIRILRKLLSTVDVTENHFAFSTSMLHLHGDSHQRGWQGEKLAGVRASEWWWNIKSMFVRRRNTRSTSSRTLAIHMESSLNCIRGLPFIPRLSPDNKMALSSPTFKMAGQWFRITEQFLQSFLDLSSQHHMLIFFSKSSEMLAIWKKCFQILVQENSNKS